MGFQASAGFSAQGPRARQEDFIIPPLDQSAGAKVFAVCDGVGGGPCGDMASKAVAEAIAGFFEGRSSLYLDQWGKLGDSIIHSLRNVAFHHPDCTGLASTLVGVVELEGDIWAFWCGDSRIYHLRGGEILWQSKDHTIRQQFADKGLAVPAGLRADMITFIANEKPAYFRLEKKRLDLRMGDRILLCTDGVHGYVPEEKWREALEKGNSCEAAAAQIQAACEELSRDNYSAWVLEWGS